MNRVFSNNKVKFPPIKITADDQRRTATTIDTKKDAAAQEADKLGYGCIAQVL